MKIKTINKAITGYKKTSTTVVFESNKGKSFEYEFFYDAINHTGDLIRNGVDYAGLWFDRYGRLQDYDMVFELSKCAIITMRKSGRIIPKIFQPSK